jgi:hypothetical protein
LPDAGSQDAHRVSDSLFAISALAARYEYTDTVMGTWLFGYEQSGPAGNGFWDGFEHEHLLAV